MSGACARRVITSATIPMPNQAKCGPARPVSADLKLPQRRRLQRRPLRSASRTRRCRPGSGKSDGIFSGLAEYCLLTGCGAYEAPIFCQHIRCKRPVLATKRGPSCTNAVSARFLPSALPARRLSPGGSIPPPRKSTRLCHSASWVLRPSCAVGPHALEYR